MQKSVALIIISFQLLYWPMYFLSCYVSLQFWVHVCRPTFPLLFWIHILWLSNQALRQLYAVHLVAINSVTVIDSY